jgi:hypothetical protein
VCALVISTSAYAEPGGTSNVYGPGVTRGESELEVRSAALHGGAMDGIALYRAEAGYGITDWWRPALALKAVEAPNAAADLTAIAIETVFDFTGTRTWPVHFGGYAEYAFGQNGRADNIEFKLLAERQQGALTARLNLGVERTLGGGASDAWEQAYAARISWRASERLSLGVEGFGEGNAHYWGPRAEWKLGAASLAFGYLAGANDAAADGQYRFALEVEH